MKEIEYKFLVSTRDYQKGLRPLHVIQAYILIEKDAHLRVRIEDGKRAYFSLKKHISGISRWEYEYDIPVTEAREIIQNFAGDRIVEKQRYFPVYAGKRWDVDEYSGANSGLITAEIELESENEHFEKPPWLGKDVSNNPAYLNINLAKHPYSMWKPEDK